MNVMLCFSIISTISPSGMYLEATAFHSVPSNWMKATMVGFFDDRAGQEYFMVVNFQHGAKMSKMDASRTLRLVFDKSVARVERLNRLTGRVETLRTSASAASRVLDLRLEGGTGDLFKWSNGMPWTLRAPEKEGS